MKNIFVWMMAATLICGASVFTACTSDISDNPVIPSQQGMEESLVGLWYEEFEYAGVLEESGVAFTSVVLANKISNIVLLMI